MNRKDWSPSAGLARLTGLTALFAVAGCNQSTLPADPPSGYVCTTDLCTAPIADPLDPAVLAAQLGPVINETLSLDPRELFTSYDTLRSTRGDAPAAVDGPNGNDDGTCPDYDVARITSTAGAEIAWDSNGGCTSGNGVNFLGSAEGGETQNFLTTDTPPIFVTDALFINTTSRIFDTDSSHFDANLNMDYTESVPAQGSNDLSVVANLTGTAFWNGAGSGSVWLSQRYSFDLSINSTDEVSTTIKELRIDGSLSGLQNPQLSAVIFEDVRMVLGPPDPADPTNVLCSSEPSGRIDVRDVNGHWYFIRFQGSSDSNDFNPNGCDGSGVLEQLDDHVFSNNSNDLAPVINSPDFSSLSGWGGRPWQ